MAQDAVLAHGCHELAVAATVAAWDGAQQEHPNDSSMMLTSRRADVRALNEGARAKRQERGVLKMSTRIQTEGGPRDFAPKDRVVFLRNDWGLGVKNGTLGTVTSLEKNTMTVRLDGLQPGKTLLVDVAAYRHLDHGYAMVHKAQGVTVDRAFVMASSSFDRHMSYVALTRHRKSVALHYSREDFATLEALKQGLSRTRLKEMGSDRLKEGPKEQPAARGLNSSIPRPSGGANTDFETLTEAQAAKIKAEALVACQARVARYEEALLKLDQRMNRLEKTKPQSLDSIREHHPRLKALEFRMTERRDDLGRLQHRAEYQQRCETAYRSKHPVRARLGLEKPRQDWRAFWEQHEKNLNEAKAGLVAAEQEKQTLLKDPAWQQSCVQAAEASKEQLEARVKQVGLDTKALENRAEGYANDVESLQEMMQDQQRRQERMKAYQGLEKGAEGLGERLGASADLQPSSSSLKELEAQYRLDRVFQREYDRARAREMDNELGR